MIWYSQQLRCKGQPTNVEITLKGEYFRNGNKNTVIIKAESRLVDESRPEQDDINYVTELYNNGSVSMRVEIPTPEDVLQKHSNRITKIRANLENKEYDLIFPTRKYRQANIKTN
jgi:hypothetical protein